MKRTVLPLMLAFLTGCSDVRDKENAMREFAHLCEVPIRAELVLSRDGTAVKMMCDQMRPAKK